MPIDLFQQQKQPRDLFAEQVKTSTGTLGSVDAAAMGLATGALEGIDKMGGLAYNILKYNAPAKAVADVGSKIARPVMNYLKDTMSPQSDFERQAVSENPHLYAAGATLGDVGIQTGTTAIASAPVTTALNKGLSYAVPMLGKSPVISGSINQGVQGAVLGAANDPEDPLRGAKVGATLGAALGGIGGIVGPKLSRSGDVQEFEQANARQAGIDPYSYEGVTRTKNALKTNGADFAKYTVGRQVTEGADEAISKIAPVLKDGEMPAETLTRFASTNFKDVRAKLKAGFTPIENIKEQFEPINFLKTKETLGSDVLKKLPDTTLPNLATPNDMWQYRQALDDNIRVLSRKAKESVLASKQVRTLTETRNALTEDLLAATNKVGLKDQFLKSEEIYRNEFLPYSVFKTDLKGNELTDKAMNDMMTKFNKFTQAKANMNINDINDITKTLGPEGKKVMGWALLQKALLDTSDAKGIVNAKTLYSKVRKYDNMGIFNKLGGEELKTTVNGIRRIADGADEMVRQGTPIDAINSVWSKLPSFLGSAVGRGLLKTIGSSKTPQTQWRNMIGQVIFGTLVIHKVQKNAASDTAETTKTSGSESIPQQP